MRRRLLIFAAAALVLFGIGLVSLRLLTPKRPTGPGSVDAAVVKPPDLSRPSHAGQQPDMAAPNTTGGVQVAVVNGKVERQLPGKGWKQARVGDKLELAEAVRTGADGTAMLSVGGGSNLEIAGASELSVREITEATHRFRLKRGRLSVDYRRDGKRVIQIENADGDAVAEAKEGQFAVLGTGDSLAVATRAGQVELASRGKAVTVNSGQQSVALRGQPPADPMAIPKEVLLSIAGLGRGPIQVNRGSTMIDGKTQPGNRLLVGDRVVAPDKSGRFSTKVKLARGKTQVRVVAEDPVGQRKQASLTYHFIPAQKATKTSKQGKIKRIDIRWGQ